MQFLRTMVLVTVLLAMLLALLTGCDSGDQRTTTQDADTDLQPEAGGMAIVALPSQPDVLNPLIRTSSVAGMIISLLQASLTEMGEDMSWQPMIAESWEVSPDSMAITYHLRPWVWENGEPLTAEDVRLSFDLVRNPIIGCPRADIHRPVTAVTVLDSATIRYEFESPEPQPELRSSHTILPRHLVAELDPGSVGSWSMNHAPLASGAFRLESWDHGQQLVLEPNPQYPLVRPWLDRVVMRVIPDETARILALETGEVDMVMSIPPVAARRLKTNPQIRLSEIEGRVFGFMMWNTRKPQLEDPTVRRAMSLAMDRERIVNDLLDGRGSVAASYLPKVLWNHHPDLAADPFRPDSARVLLEQAGWVDTDGDGVREKNGQELSLEILFRGGNPLIENGVVLLRHNLADVGVAVDLRSLELATALSFLRSGRFDAYFGEFQANLYADPSPLVMSGATDRFNFGGYANDRVDSLLATALAETNRELSLPIWYALQEELMWDQPAAVLYYPNQVVGYQGRLHDVRPHKLSPVNNLTEWWIAPRDRHWSKKEYSK